MFLILKKDRPDSQGGKANNGKLFIRVVQFPLGPLGIINGII